MIIMSEKITLYQLIRNVIEGSLNYSERFKEEDDYSILFEGIDDLEIIEEILFAIDDDKFHLIPDEIIKFILENSSNIELKEKVKSSILSHKNPSKSFYVRGMKHFINEFSSELYWALTDNHRLRNMTIDKLLDNIKNGVLSKFEIDSKKLIKNLFNNPNFNYMDPEQQKIVLIGEILRQIEINKIKVPYDKKEAAFLIRAKIYSEILVKNFNKSHAFLKRVNKMLKNYKLLLL